MPNGVTVHGTPGPIRISEQRDVSRTDAPELREIYRGERVATFSAFGLLANNATRASYRQDGASATIDRTFKDESQCVETVEIDFNAVQRDWFTSPYFSTLTGGEVRSVMGRVALVKEYAETNSAATGEPHTDVEVASYIQTLADAFNNPKCGDGLVDVLQNGETYIALLPVITYTLSVAQNYATQFVIADIGKVFYTDSMNANVPLNPQFVVSEITNTIGANPNQTLGWLKMGRYGISSDGGAQYVQQYIFDAYPTLRYTFV